MISTIKDVTSQVLQKNFNISRQLVNVWYRKYETREDVKNIPRFGRRKQTTNTSIKSLEEIPWPTLKKGEQLMEINNDLRDYYGINIYISIVKYRLKEFGLHGRRPNKKPQINAKNGKARLQENTNIGHLSGK